MRYKAGLVGRGFAQKKSFDFDVAKMATIRTLLALGNFVFFYTVGHKNGTP